LGEVATTSNSRDRFVKMKWHKKAKQKRIKKKGTHNCNTKHSVNKKYEDHIWQNQNAKKKLSAQPECEDE
jgi:hypothetical protein